MITMSITKKSKYHANKKTIDVPLFQMNEDHHSLKIDNEPCFKNAEMFVSAFETILRMNEIDVKKTGRNICPLRSSIAKMKKHNAGSSILTLFLFLKRLIGKRLNINYLIVMVILPVRQTTSLITWTLNKKNRNLYTITTWIVIWKRIVVSPNNLVEKATTKLTLWNSYDHFSPRLWKPSLNF